MYQVQVKSIVVSMLTAACLVLAGCSGDGDAVSGSGGSASGGTMLVRGNVSDFGTAMFHHRESEVDSIVSRYASSLADALLPSADAQTVLSGIQVCMLAVCTVTAADGSFFLDLTGAPAGDYEITFEYDGVVYSSIVSVQNNTILTLSGIILLTETGNVTITNVNITVVASPDDDGEVDDGEVDEEDDGPTEKFVICHKPGTPAQKNLSLPASAIPGHLGHGDTEGACDIEF